MKPIANNFGDVRLPPTDPRYVDGAPGSKVPSVSGMSQDTARQRLREPASRSPTRPPRSTAPRRTEPWSALRPSGQTVPGSIVTIQITNGIPPPPPPPPPGAIRRAPDAAEIGQTVVEIPGLPPITVPVLGPPPPPPPP